jgi:hypothetical protein
MLERGRPGGAFSRAAHVPPAKSKDAARLAAFSFFARHAASFPGRLFKRRAMC